LFEWPERSKKTERLPLVPSLFVSRVIELELNLNMGAATDRRGEIDQCPGVERACGVIPLGLAMAFPSLSNPLFYSCRIGFKSETIPFMKDFGLVVMGVENACTRRKIRKAEPITGFRNERPLPAAGNQVDKTQRKPPSDDGSR
jgi:hypothetical protein